LDEPTDGTVLLATPRELRRRLSGGEAQRAFDILALDRMHQAPLAFCK
jgi:hypothetical protein